MKVVELSGGIQTFIPRTEYEFLKKILAKEVKSFKIDNLTERQRFLSDSLVKYNILDKEDDIYYLKEVHIL